MVITAVQHRTTGRIEITARAAHFLALHCGLVSRNLDTCSTIREPSIYKNLCKVDAGNTFMATTESKCGAAYGKTFNHHCCDPTARDNKSSLSEPGDSKPLYRYSLSGHNRGRWTRTGVSQSSVGFLVGDRQ